MVDAALATAADAATETVADAALATAADAPTETAADVALATAADAATETVADAALATAADAATETPSDIVTATTASPGEPPTPSGERLDHRPRRREINEIIEALSPEVQRCIAAVPRRRRVRIRVTWEGSTGRATSVRVSSTYADPPVGPCLEQAIRARPVTRFTEDDFATTLSFEAR
jgi:hypothetical protein